MDEEGKDAGWSLLICSQRDISNGVAGVKRKAEDEHRLASEAKRLKLDDDADKPAKEPVKAPEKLKRIPFPEKVRQTLLP